MGLMQVAILHDGLRETNWGSWWESLFLLAMDRGVRVWKLHNRNTSASRTLSLIHI